MEPLNSPYLKLSVKRVEFKFVGYGHLLLYEGEELIMPMHRFDRQLKYVIKNG